MRRTVLATGAMAVAALAISACSGDSMGTGMGDGSNGSGHTAQRKATPRRAGQFRLYEWGITADADQLVAGSQTITAVNTGRETHELVIVRGTEAALKTKSDGSVEEKAIKSTKVGEIADVAAGSSKHATFVLVPGTYVVFCNIVENMDMGGGMQHTHFARGMRTTFTVKPA